MKITQLFSKPGPPVNRWTYALVSILFLNSIMGLSSSSGRAEFIYNCVIFSFTVLMWPLFTIRRLIDIRRSRLWILPILLPVVIALIALFEGRKLVFGIAAGLAFTFQLPLILLPISKDFLSLKEIMSPSIESSNRPKP
jgi:uncharacterized membrane protein YhaH (DUF805 family)